MDWNLIFNGQATLQDLEELGNLGYEFVIEDGKVTEILHG